MKADPSESIRLTLLLTPNSSPSLSCSLSFLADSLPLSLFVLSLSRDSKTKRITAEQGTLIHQEPHKHPKRSKDSNVGIHLRDTLRMFCGAVL